MCRSSKGFGRSRYNLAVGLPVLAKGKQYIMVAAGGRDEPAELVALAEHE
jgi:hypothetical protein